MLILLDQLLHAPLVERDLVQQLVATAVDIVDAGGEDRRRLAASLGIPTRQFTQLHCDKTNGYFHLKETGPDCRFLAGTRCGVYEARPTQCRTWPFWPENMAARSWTAIAAYCPGVGKGKPVPRERIEAILAEQARSTARL